MLIQWNRVHKSISGESKNIANAKDESTLLGCIGQPLIKDGKGWIISTCITNGKLNLSII